MRLIAHPSIDTTPLEALRVSMRAWCVDILVWLITKLEPLRARRRTPAWLKHIIAAAERQLDADLRETARGLRMLLLVHAYARMPAAPTPAFKQTTRPTSVRRRAPSNSAVRKFTSVALKGLHAGSLKQRAERLRDMLDNPEPLIAAILTHMTRMFKHPRLPGVLARITQAALSSVAHIRTPACADTS